ncbi:MAG: type II toxin-antitoxin system prevent-host-death family antitoxin [Polynucleobacter sp.]
MTITIPIHAETTISVSALIRSNPAKVLEDAGGNPVAILNHNKPVAYLLTAKVYERLLNQIDDLTLLKIIKKRKGAKIIEAGIDVL